MLWHNETNKNKLLKCGLYCKKCGLPAEIRVTRRDAGTRSHAGKNPQKPETRTPVTRNYPKPDFSTRNPSLYITIFRKVRGCMRAERL